MLPGLAFSLDLIVSVSLRTSADKKEATGLYGVQEVLLASVWQRCGHPLAGQADGKFIAAGTAAFFGGQPLLISGVTGECTLSV